MSAEIYTVCFPSHHFQDRSTVERFGAVESHRTFPDRANSGFADTPFFRSTGMVIESEQTNRI
jgi:hypothetical protein